jgi:hypothetical protein
MLDGPSCISEIIRRVVIRRDLDRLPSLAFSINKPLFISKVIFLILFYFLFFSIKEACLLKMGEGSPLPILP